MKNFYEILNVSITSSMEQIKQQYRELAKKYHPDVSHEEKALPMFNLITRAYKTLTDKKRRIEYNERLMKVRFKAQAGDLAVDEKKEIKIIYSRSLGVLAKRGFFLSTIPKRFREKNDIKYDIEVVVDYYEAQKGGIIEIAVPTKLPCWECQSRDHYCPICDGKGYIMRPTKIKVVIPTAPRNGEIFEVNLSKIKQGNLAVIRAQKLRLKIVLSNDKTDHKQLSGV
ncbi:MAG: DnaJ domain-containing protein [Spirochaetes bacterium]|nr:DnaJ domain-containing protein [Spirochaetota bacterium]